ncbi:cold-shock DNA-binding domain protein [Candidatus Vecturithrix granuli]|uniref:Cold-shock DNA-binding domain protein n=1 Tax=Vecturithrix granuli TaxID=1499967 RepID=A0A081BXQ4_VECG1|nr:cold-shock DNA-binding domain protein [Candidatus Vecturithrix granuli]
MKLIKTTQLFSLCKMLVLMFFLLNLSSALWGFVYSDPQPGRLFPSTSSQADDSVKGMLTHLKHVLSYQFLPLAEGDESTPISFEQDTDQGPQTTDHSLLIQIARSYNTFEQRNLTPSSPGKILTRFPGITKQIQLLLIGGVLLTIGTIFIPTFLPQLHQHPAKIFRAFHRSHSQHSAEIRQKKRRRSYASLRLTDSAVAERLLRTKISTQQQERISDTVDAEKDCLEEIWELEEYDMNRNNHEMISSPSVSQKPFDAPENTIRTFFQQSGFEFVSQNNNHQVLHATHIPYNRYGAIPLFIMTDTVLDASAIQQICAAIAPRNDSNTLQLAFIIVDTIPSSDAYTSIYTCKSQTNMLLIPIAIQLINKALRQRTPAHILEKLLSTALKGNNLYDTNTPVENPLDFFGREDMINTLLDAVSRLQHIGLFGLRKIGKTSMIWQVREKLARHIVAYIDLQHISQELSSVYQAILAECLREASYKYPEVILPDFSLLAQEVASDPGAQLGQMLVSLWECLKPCCHDLKIIILFDEAEHLIPAVRDSLPGFSGFHQLVGTIRGISQQYGFLVSLMVSSSPDISRIDTWKGQNNPGFQYYKEVFVSTLSEEECNRMITTLGIQVGLRYTEESLSRIYYETGGHPYVTRQLCSLIVKKLLNNQAAHARHTSKMKENSDLCDTSFLVEVKDVEYAVSEYLEYKRDYLESIWQRLPQTEQEILLIIIKNESCALDDLIARHHSHQIKRERRKVISTLIENEIIEKCENKYSIRMGLFARYLLTTN